MGYNINRHSALDHAVDLAKEDLIDSDPATIVEAAEVFHAFLAPKKAKPNPAVFEASDDEEVLADPDPDEYLYFVWSYNKNHESAYRIQRKYLGSESENVMDAWYGDDTVPNIHFGFLSGRFAAVNGLIQVDKNQVPDSFRADLIKADSFGYTESEDRAPGDPMTWLLLEDGRTAFVDDADSPDKYCTSSYEPDELRDILNGNPETSYSPKHLGVTYVPRDLVIADHY